MATASPMRTTASGSTAHDSPGRSLTIRAISSADAVREAGAGAGAGAEWMITPFVEPKSLTTSVSPTCSM
jgi:hypothetical protein